LKLIGPLSLIQLSSHKPACRDNIGEFANWIYIGTGTGYIRVPPHYKYLIINAIKLLGIQLSPSNNQLTLIKGNQHIMGYELGKIFQDLGIDSLRIVMYGMKSQYNWKPIDDAIKNHPQANLNFWDIGRNYHHKDIILAKTNISNTFPMLNYIGQKHGWVSKSIDKINFKIYPRLTHILKSEKQMQSWNLPKIRTTLSKKQGQLNSLYDTLLLKSNDPINWGYGGLRIEARINALTLAQAKDIVSKKSYLDNISTILNSAAANNLWTINSNENKVTNQQTQRIIDVFNAFGWCPTDKLFKPTNNLLQQWWGFEVVRDIYTLEQPNIFTKEELKDKFKTALNNNILKFCWENGCNADSFCCVSRPNRLRIKCNGTNTHYCEHESIDRWINDNYQVYEQDVFNGLIIRELPYINGDLNDKDIAIDIVNWASGTNKKTGNKYYTWRIKETKNKSTMYPSIEEAANALIMKPNWREIPILKKQFRNSN
ncbi:hypothetical protein CONCODRAFT_70069, partial [Conidiobolus coronatus NRRL 28638]